MIIHWEKKYDWVKLILFSILFIIEMSEANFFSSDSNGFFTNLKLPDGSANDHHSDSFHGCSWFTFKKKKKPEELCHWRVIIDQSAVYLTFKLTVLF